MQKASGYGFFGLNIYIILSNKCFFSKNVGNIEGIVKLQKVDDYVENSFTYWDNT